MLGTAQGFPICVRGDTPQGYHHLVASRNAELLLKPVKKGEKPLEKPLALLLWMSKYYPVLEKKSCPFLSQLNGALLKTNKRTSAWSLKERLRWVGPSSMDVREIRLEISGIWAALQGYSDWLRIVVFTKRNSQAHTPTIEKLQLMVFEETTAQGDEWGA